MNNILKYNNLYSEIRIRGVSRYSIGRVFIKIFIAAISIVREIFFISTTTGYARKTRRFLTIHDLKKNKFI